MEGVENPDDLVGVYFVVVAIDGRARCECFCCDVVAVSRRVPGRGPFYDGDDCGDGASRVVPDAFQKNLDCLLDLDEHGPDRRHCGGSEDDAFSPVTVRDRGEPHFASAVAEGVDGDPDLGKLLGFVDYKPRFVAEGIEQLRVDVPLGLVLRDPEDFSLKLPLLAPVQGRGGVVRGLMNRIW